MKIKYIILLLLIGVFSFRLKAQIQELKIGNRVADLDFKNLLNYETKQARLSDFKGKIVIFDFWNTGCGPCISAFPRLDSLQKKFKDQLVILPVTRENNDVVSAFIDRFASVRKIKLSMPFENQNTELENYFPHLTVPHQTWINKDGIYLGATQEIIDSTLAGVLSGKIMNLGETNNKIIAFNPLNPFEILSLGKPIMYKEKGIDFENRYSEAMTKHIVGVSGISGLLSISPRIFATNLDIPNLYAMAFGLLTTERKSIPYAKIIIDVKDKERLILPKDKKLAKEWWDKNSYCYDLMLTDFPPKYPKDVSKPQKLKNDTILSKILLKTLSSQFGYKVNMEKREVECLIYKIIDSTLLQTSGGECKFNVYPGYTGAFIRNTKLSKVIDNFSHSLQNYIVIDETNYDGAVDIDLNVPLYDPKALHHEYAKYGLSLTLEKRFVNMLVISDK